MRISQVSCANFSGIKDIFKRINKNSAKAEDDTQNVPYTRDITINYIPDFLLKRSKLCTEEPAKNSAEECEQQSKTKDAKAEAEKRKMIAEAYKKSAKTGSDLSNTRKAPSYHIPDFLLKRNINSVKEYRQTPKEKAKIALDEEACRIISYEGSKCLEGTDYQVAELFKKHGDDKDAMEYVLHRAINRERIGSGGLRKWHEPYNDFLKAYLNEINSYFGNNKNKRHEYLDMVLFTKNKDGNTLAQAVVRPTGVKSSEIFKLLFDATEDFPDLQVKILKDKEGKYGKTIGERVGYIFDKNEDSIIINKVLHRLCTETDALSRIDAIDLLTENSSILDDKNKKLLAVLKTKKRTRAIDNKKPRSGAKQKNTDKTKQYKISRKTAKRKNTRSARKQKDIGQSNINAKQKTNDSKIIDFKEAVDRPHLSKAAGDNSPSIRFYDCVMEG